MILILTDQDQKIIFQHLEECYPEEGCGFLVGKFSGQEKSVLEIHPVKNTKQETRERRYFIDPKDFMEVEVKARKQNLEIVGIYHSHPDHPSKPSEFDRTHAWPWYSYVVVAVEKGRSKELTSWVLSEDSKKFIPEEIRKE